MGWNLTWTGGVAAAALAACGGEAERPLRLDVLVGERWVEVLAIEAEPPHACTRPGFVPPETCDHLTDAWTCDGPEPGAILARVRVERGGAVVADVAWDTTALAARTRTAVAGQPDVSIVIVARDGREARIPVPPLQPPRPTITSVMDGGDAVDVRWEVDAPAVTAIVAVENDVAGRRCHVPATGGTVLDWAYPYTRASVHAFAGTETHSTPFGDAHVWVGDRATLAMP